MLHRCLPPPRGRPTRPLVSSGLEFILWSVAALPVSTWWESIINQFSKRGAVPVSAGQRRPQELCCNAPWGASVLATVLSSEDSYCYVHGEPPGQGSEQRH